MGTKNNNYCHTKLCGEYFHAKTNYKRSRYIRPIISHVLDKFTGLWLSRSAVEFIDWTSIKTSPNVLTLGNGCNMSSAEVMVSEACPAVTAITHVATGHRRPHCKGKRARSHRDQSKLIASMVFQYIPCLDINTTLVTATSNHAPKVSVLSGVLGKQFSSQRQNCYCKFDRTVFCHSTVQGHL